MRDYCADEANEIIGRYVERKRLAALGIMISGSEIPAFICDAFLTIERTLDDIRAEEEKKRKSSPARKR